MSAKLMGWALDMAPFDGTELLALHAICDWANDEGVTTFGDRTIENIARRARVKRRQGQRLVAKLEATRVIERLAGKEGRLSFHARGGRSCGPTWRVETDVLKWAPETRARFERMLQAGELKAPSWMTGFLPNKTWSSGARNPDTRRPKPGHPNDQVSTSHHYNHLRPSKDPYAPARPLTQVRTQEASEAVKRKQAQGGPGQAPQALREIIASLAPREGAPPIQREAYDRSQPSVAADESVSHTAEPAAPAQSPAQSGPSSK